LPASRFYRDDFIPAFRDDFVMTPISRCIGIGQLVDELQLDFTHSRSMPWLLPGVAPTNRRIRMNVVVIVQFRGDKLACERIYWDHHAVLRQVGLVSG
jgi:carboxymethylenebutenolidase